MRAIGLGLASVLVLASGASAQSRAVSNTELHDALHLTSAQEDAWRDYQAAIAPDPALQQRHHATDLLLPQLTTPRRVALIEATAQADNADLHRQGEAVKAFYAALSADQQRVFDRLTADRVAQASNPAPQSAAAGAGAARPPGD